MIAQLSDAISDIRQKIDYFVAYEEIPLSYKSISMDVLQRGNNTWLVAGGYNDINGVSCMNTTVFRKQGDNASFQEFRKVRPQIIA